MIRQHGKGIRKEKLEEFRGVMRSQMVLSCVPARGLFRFKMRVIAQTSYGLSGKCIESRIAGLQVQKKPLSHTGSPEAPDMVFYTAGFATRLSTKETLDIIRHLH
jgi:hypothetical protein